MSDPAWQGGYYYNTSKYPSMGMKLSREIGTISYRYVGLLICLIVHRSGPEWEERFSRKRVGPGPSFGPDFQIEGYLDHQVDFVLHWFIVIPKQGTKFSKEYDPNSLLYISKAMDMFDMGDEQKSYEAGIYISYVL